MSDPQDEAFSEPPITDVTPIPSSHVAMATTLTLDAEPDWITDLDGTRLRACLCLSELISTCLDAQDLYQSASERCYCDVLRGQLMDESHRRASFASRLQKFQRLHGQGRPDEANSFRALARLAWIELSSVFKTTTNEDLRHEIEQQEDKSIETYERMLADYPAEHFPNEAATIEAQLRHLRQARRTWRQILEEAVV